MNKCEGCGCMTFDRVMLDSGLKVCEYCSAEDTNRKILAKVHQPRDLNNLTWLVKQDHKTVRNWAKKHGFEYSLVMKVLNQVTPYDRTNIHNMTKKHFDVMMALCDSGYRDTLVFEGYITHV